jgi:hypothetical protein
MSIYVISFGIIIFPSYSLLLIDMLHHFACGIPRRSRSKHQIIPSQIKWIAVSSLYALKWFGVSD